MLRNILPLPIVILTKSILMHNNLFIVSVEKKKISQVLFSFFLNNYYFKPCLSYYGKNIPPLWEFLIILMLVKNWKKSFSHYEFFPNLTLLYFMFVFFYSKLIYTIHFWFFFANLVYKTACIINKL